MPSQRKPGLEFEVPFLSGGGRAAAAQFRRGLGTSPAELWPDQGVLSCWTTVAIASKSTLCGSMYVTKRNGVGMEAEVSSICDVGALLSSG